MTDIAAAAPAVVGRSLWGDAWARLKANRAAMFSLYYLAFIALISVFGPSLVPHEYTTIYGDYVRTPPSFSAYPKPDMIQTALTDAIKRMRVDIKEWHQDGSRVIVTVTSKKPIDDRYIRYLDRSDAFDDTKIDSKSPDGLEVTMSAAIKQQYFYFGTDNTGRDLLSRT
ncbi:ABC transporter permease, partial [Mesorhizobium sp. M4B.F.Ca.ET.017.02.2.1]